VAAPSGISPGFTVLNPHVLAGSSALVIALLLLLVYAYRRRQFILWWIVAWLLLAGSMLFLSRSYQNEKLGWMVYGISQLFGLLASLAFVVAADAYRQRPKLKRGYGLVLMPLAIWFALAPVALGPRAVFALGHLLIAGGMAAGAGAHLLLLRQRRLLGAAVVAGMLLVLAGLNIWTAVAVSRPEGMAAIPPLVGMSVVFLGGALGQQLMAFEDMTYELRLTNSRLESAQGDLREMVITDPLTGMRNRRFFDEIIGRELQRHRRYRTPLSVVFVDIDRFKAINDTLGHEIGDRVLQEVASFLLRNIREADYVFRWGGDEFVVLISCPEDEALRRSRDLQHAFAAAPHTVHLPPGVALSVGVVEVPLDVDDIMPLIQAADERMYANKKKKRRA
jgi:diguanylate cyclase (GGDEF)-like protein